MKKTTVKRADEKGLISQRLLEESGKESPTYRSFIEGIYLMEQNGGKNES